MRVPKRFKRPTSRAIWMLPTIENIASEAKTPVEYLESIASREFDPYVDFKLRKATGGARLISKPVEKFRPALSHIYSHLHHDFIHKAAYAYVPHRSVVDCARAHEGMVWGVKVDLKNFFGSIDEDQVYIALVSCGLSSARARGISKLTTRAPIGSHGPDAPSSFKGPVRGHGKARAKVRRVGHLPQGSSTSGYLANLVAWDLDCAITELAEKMGLTYTRYSDDILVSSRHKNFDRDNALALVGEIRNIVNTYGFDLNAKKTRILTPGSRKQHLGLLLDDPGVRLTADKRKSLESAIWAIEKYGFSEHAKHLGYASQHPSPFDLIEIGDQYLNKFWGRLAYVLDVEPNFARELLTRFVATSSEDFYLSNESGGAMAVKAAERILTHANRWL